MQFFRNGHFIILLFLVIHCIFAQEELSIEKIQQEIIKCIEEKKIEINNMLEKMIKSKDVTPIIQYLQEREKYLKNVEISQKKDYLKLLELFYNILKLIKKEKEKEIVWQELKVNDTEKTFEKNKWYQIGEKFDLGADGLGKAYFIQIIVQIDQFPHRIATGAVATAFVGWHGAEAISDPITIPMDIHVWELNVCRNLQIRGSANHPGNRYLEILFKENLKIQKGGRITIRLKKIFD